MKKNRFVLILLSLLLVQLAGAQEPVDVVTVPIDYRGREAPMDRGQFKGFWRGDYPNPKKALIMSFVLPGSGQAYNRKWWKIPLVYGTLGGLTWLEIHNYRYYKGFRDNYKWAVDEDPNTNPTKEPYIYLDDTDLKYYRDQSRRTLEQSSLVLGLAYLLAATDAFVDAHLASFDVSDDLSLRVHPGIYDAPGMPAFGFGVVVPLGRQVATKP